MIKSLLFGNNTSKPAFIYSGLVLYWFLLFTSSFLKAAPVVYEAETGTLTGTYTSTAAAGYTGSGYVTGFDAANDAARVTVNMAAAGGYILSIRYRASLGDKTQDVYVNGVFAFSVFFPSTTGFVSLQAGGVNLNAGNNTISIVNNWGYMDVDHFSIEAPPSIAVTTDLINPNADTKTKALYALLRSQYGNCIFTGQTGYWDELIAITGESPAVRGFDMQNYSPMNPWGWSGCCAAWGGWDDGTVQQAIDWYNGTGGKGSVTFHWHWFSPSGGTIRTSTFYTSSTNFDVSRAVVPGNQEYTDVIRDIDAIAVQLKRLQTAGVPVLWRPLHEAGGTWFWWGAKGAAACKSLYDIMYNRLTNYHGLNNLIWVWSSPEPSWYPGNSKVDIIGYDSYPGAYNYTTQKSMFDQLNTIVGGQKLVALTENGPIPDIDQAFADGAPWSFFMSWVDLVTAQNSNAHIIEAYNQGCNLSDVVGLPVSLLSFTAEEQGEEVVLNWKTISEENNERFDIEKSVDGIVFKKLGEVKGAIHSSSLKEYQFSDTNPGGGKLYYRLKQLDLDGAFAYSSVVSVIRQQEKGFQVYPNPGTGIYRLAKNNEALDVELKITNASGQIVLQKTYLRSYNVPEIEFSISDKPAGIYYLEIAEAGHGTVQKLVKY